MYAFFHSMPCSLPQTIHRRTASNEALRPLAPPPPSHEPMQNSPALTSCQMPLPDGWEQAITGDGLTYFINHHEQSTTWADPRTLIPGSGGGGGPAMEGAVSANQRAGLRLMPNGGSAHQTASPMYSPIPSQQFLQQIKRAVMKLQHEFAMLIKHLHELLQYEVVSHGGQTLDIVGLSLLTHCFSHGQFYVACSRVHSPHNLYVLTHDNKTKNIVYHEIFH